MKSSYSYLHETHGIFKLWKTNSQLKFQWCDGYELLDTIMKQKQIKIDVEYFVRNFILKKL